MNANYKEDELFPALNDSGQIVLNTSDRKEKGTISVDSIEYCELINNRIETLYSIKDAPEDAWELTLTASRIVFWSTYFSTLFSNRAKQQTISVSAGHIYYKNIAGLRLSNPESDWPFIGILIIRMDGTPAHFLIKADNDELAQITTTLGQCLAEFWKQAAVRSKILSKELLNLTEFDWHSCSSNDQLINLCHAPVTKVLNIPTGAGFSA